MGKVLLELDVEARRQGPDGRRCDQPQAPRRIVADRLDVADVARVRWRARAGGPPSVVSDSRCLARCSVVRSWRYGPTICTPIGRPSALIPDRHDRRRAGRPRRRARSTRNRSMYERSTPSIDDRARRRACRDGRAGSPDVGAPASGSRRSRRRTGRPARAVCSRRSLCAEPVLMTHRRARASPRRAAVSSVLAAMWSSASGGKPVGERGEQQRRGRRSDTCSRLNAGRASTSTRPPADSIESTSDAEHTRRVGVDRAPRIVDPRGDPEVGQLRRPVLGGRSSRHAGAFQRSGPASTPSSSSRSSTDRAIGPNTPMSADVNVPGGPGMWPWPGTRAKLDL